MLDRLTKPTPELIHVDHLDPIYCQIQQTELPESLQISHLLDAVLAEVQLQRRKKAEHNNGCLVFLLWKTKHIPWYQKPKKPSEINLCGNGSAPNLRPWYGSPAPSVATSLLSTIPTMGPSTGGGVHVIKGHTRITSKTSDEAFDGYLNHRGHQRWRIH